MTDNNDTWKDLIDKSYEYPDGLSGVEQRLENRIVREKRKRKTIGSLSTIAAMFSFVLLVNTSTVFASIVSEIPILGTIAEYVKFDKSLSSAIENDYIQEVNLISWDGQEKLMLPYVIADEKNLVLFFQLPQEFKQESNEWLNIMLKDMIDVKTGKKVEGYSYSTSGLSLEGRYENHGLILQEYHFSEGTLPKSVELEVMLEKETIKSSQEVNIADNDFFSDEDDSIRENLGTFKFNIDFDEFKEPIMYELNENHKILGQDILVEYIKVYPTGTEVRFLFPKENASWVKGIELEMVHDDNNILKGNNGISATHGLDNDWMNVFIESNYFDNPKNQELLIKAVRLLDKNEEFITVDLDNKNIIPTVKGMELKEVKEHQGKASLTFATQVTENDNFGMFHHEYRDEEGNKYEFREEGSSSFDFIMETRITTVYPSDGKVILQRSLTPKIILEEPIRIKIPSGM